MLSNKQEFDLHRIFPFIEAKVKTSLHDGKSIDKSFELAIDEVKPFLALRKFIVE